jgi:CHASE2 domain-containing sensor protein
MWQDIVISATQWSLALFLLPTVLHKDNKPTFTTSTLTATALSVLSVTFLTMGFWNSFAASGIVSILWFILAYQRYKLSKKNDTPLINRPSWLDDIRETFLW